MQRAVIALEGHIIDSLQLPRVWDTIMDMGGNFDVEEFRVGKRKNEVSYLRLSVHAKTEKKLDDILSAIQPLGATPIDQGEARLALVRKNGVFPLDFYSTSNQ